MLPCSTTIAAALSAAFFTRTLRMQLRLSAMTQEQLYCSNVLQFFSSEPPMGSIYFSGRGCKNQDCLRFTECT